MLSLQVTDHLSPDDAARLTALARTRLLDSPPEERFDRLTALAAQMLGTPVALVTLVDAKRAFVKSSHGMEEQLETSRDVPLSHSICRHVVARRSSVVVEDARLDPELRENGAVRDYGTVAYAGIPIVDRDGHTLGAFCVIDTKPRQWNERELASMRTLADWASAEIGNDQKGASASERAEWEEEAEARQSAVIARVVSVIAHDFNNVLTCVAGYSDLLLGDESLDAAVREDVSEIARAADRGTAFTKQLAILARRPKPTIAPVDVNALLHELSRAHESGSPAITIGLQLAAALPHALADRAQLEQVLGLLLANTRDALPNGGTVTLSSSVATDARGVARVCISVRDTGVGMDAETMSSAFDPFFTTRKLTGGRGLGLTTVRSLLTEVKGKVDVESTVGAGSMFTVTLPAAE